ncbi:MAG: tetratricopeptide repeat protein [Actinobacteria bacterium]|nr:tetratricopeptide repeat protein [Actinomycetota bacterium]
MRRTLDPLTVLRGLTYVVIAAIIFVSILLVNSFMNQTKNKTPRTEAERAIIVAETAVKADPNDPKARANLAAAYLAAGRYSDAVKQAEFATRLNPDEGTGYLVLGIAQRELGRYDEAIKNIQRALKDENKTADWYVKAWIELATTYEKKNDIKKAKEALDGAIGYFPEASDLYFQRARLTEKLGDYYGAFLDYQAVLEFDPDNQQAREAINRIRPMADKQKKERESKKK